MRPTFSPTAEEVNILAQSGTADQRDRIFATLRVRNRLVGVLRFAVPTFGGVVFGGLMLQLFFASLGEDFGFSNVSIDRNNLVVDTPSYASMGADGSSYQVQAESARSALDRTDIIHLTKAKLTISRPGGAVITASAEEALLDTSGQTVRVAGVTRIADSKGTKGTLVGMSANFATETAVGDGAVDITFSNGATLTAASMSYDGTTSTWKFSRATLTLQSTPGETETIDAGPRLDSRSSSQDLPRFTSEKPVVPAPEPAGRRPIAEERP